jgi:hypothetical protein
MGLSPAALTLVLAAGNPADARTAFSDFVDRLYTASTPITGTFVVRTHINRSKADEDRIRERQPGARLTFEPTEQVLRCRWSFDRTRELVDPLAGSTGTFRRFLTTPDVNVVGHAPSRYTLSSGRVPYTRPASFYFLGGDDGRWNELLGNPAATFAVDSTDDGQEHRIELAGAGTTRLTADHQGRLRRAEVTVNGAVVWTLTVGGYVSSPAGNKHFPKQADILMNRPDNGELLCRYRLDTDAVSFPSSSSDLSTAFRLDLPKRAVVADPQLRQTITLPGGATGHDVIREPSKFPRKPFKPAPAQARFVDEGEPSDTGRDWWLWLPAGVLVAVVAVVVVRGRGQFRTSSR